MISGLRPWSRFGVGIATLLAIVGPGLRARAAASEEPAADVVRFAGLSAEESAKAITLPKGFKAYPFAAEPDVRQPIAFCLDHRGRVWVAEGMSYPKRKGNPPADDRSADADRSKPSAAQLSDIFGGLDRILVLEDTDGDHKFDRRTVFLDKVNLISGLEVGFGGVWIGAAPYLMYVPIADGDAPKPAGDPVILLDGWDYQADTHETLNTFTWGPDGWLYGCHGVFCPSHVGQPGTPKEKRQRTDCAVWRYHPVKHQYEIFTEGTSNPWGIDFDEHGQLFQEACVIPHFWHMIQGARYERQGGQHFAITLEEMERCQKHLPNGAPRHVNPFIYDNIRTHGDHVHWAGSKGPHAANARSDAVGGGHAHAGLMVYLGGSWPEEFHNKILIGNIHGQRLNMDFGERQGSGYVGRHAPDFLNFNDTWSQTLNQLYDQDGSMYVIDWYDVNQCHHNREDGHDRSNGRIYKVVYGNTPVTRVDLTTKSDAELVALLNHRNHWMSRHAQRILAERAWTARPPSGIHAKALPSKSGAPESVKAALATQFAKATSSVDRLRVLWAMHAASTTSEAMLLGLLKDADEYVRAWSIQLLCESRQPSDATLTELARMAREDNSAFVRLYLASAMQRTPVSKRLPVLEPLVTRDADVNDHNLPLMYWFALEPVVGGDGAVGLDLLTKVRIPTLRQFITRRLASEALVASR